IATPRYRFRYEGRWLMTDLEVSSDPQGDWTYGPDLVDQWKARAFQQRPSGQTPCCGYEEEVNNWGGSSILMGELAGPVRVIRETWGADSGTNVVRREIFYRDEIRLGSFLRVHVIPPLDGIYAQWDYNADMVDTYRNPFRPDGVAIDGRNDEVFGNSRLHVGPDGVSYDGDDESSDELDGVTGSETQGIGDENEPSCQPVGPHSEIYNQLPEDMRNEIEDACIYNDIDSPDPTFSGVVAGPNWEQISGDHGTLVLRNAIKQFTPGGTAQGLIAVPYYRDDSCFDDGTGSNPGPHVNGRNADPGSQECSRDSGDRQGWDSETDETPPVEGDPQYFQGSIGTHGVHILVIAESDNAHSTVPITEIDSEQRMVVLPGRQENVGDAYGRAPEKPLVVTTAPESRGASPEPEQEETELTITGARSGQITDSATLSARLTSQGEGVAGKEIVFTVDGEEVDRDDTDGNGEASVTVTLQPPARSATQGATFAGDSGYLGISASDVLDILLDDPSLQIAVSNMGNQATATATLTDTDSGAALSGRTVRFLVNGSDVGSSVTDGSGSASASFKAKKGDTVRAVFDGDDSYSNSSAERQRT
ncbi:MAG: Ig-like domain-containing protein, partial [Actinomycetota bacterium]